MSYETKAGVAVSCSFLCLVGVVLSSKLWDGQAANAGTNPTEVETKEPAGNGIQPLTGVGAANPKLQTPPNDLQLVKGTGAAPRTKISELFKDDDDPFLATPYQSDDAPPATTANTSTSPSPGFKLPDATSSPVMSVETPAKNAAATVAGATPPPGDIKKSGEKSLDEILKGISSGSNAPAGEMSKPNPVVAPVTSATIPMMAPGKSLAEMAEEADKQKQAIEAQLANATKNGGTAAENLKQGAAALGGDALQQSNAIADNLKQSAADLGGNAIQQSNAVADNLKKDASALGGNALQQSGAGIDNIAAELAKQKSIAQGAAMDMGAGKSALLSGEMGLGGSKPLTGAAVAIPATGAAVAIPTMGAGLAGAGLTGAAKEVGNPGNFVGSNAPALNVPENQPKFPGAGANNSAGQTELGASPAGLGTNAAASLGAPAVPAMAPPPANNQVAQLGNGGTASANPEAPPYGARPEARVQPVNVPVPSVPVPSQKDHWDDELCFGQTSDTFATIAREKYHSERYADALMYYNRDHLLATEATKHNPGTIVQGQRIYLPPERILKRDYGAAILEESEVKTGRGVSPAKRPATTGANPSAPLPEKTYRVRGRGEMFLTIARNTLGNELRWSEIYQLNSRFEPTVEVPGGTVLRMPGDAKIDPADAASKP
jgi:hypothetical protein